MPAVLVPSRISMSSVSAATAELAVTITMADMPSAMFMSSWPVNMKVTAPATSRLTDTQAPMHVNAVTAPRADAMPAG